MLHVSQVFWCYENLESCLGCHVLKENTVSDFLDAMFFFKGQPERTQEVLQFVVDVVSNK